LLACGGAAAGGIEDGAGSITPGGIADVVVLGADPTRVAAAEIGSIPVRATVVEGRVAWSA
jgi:predicted amidohydrolase YtcJ